MNTKLKRIFVYCLFASLGGCTIPGSYIGPGDSGKAVTLNGHKIKPLVIKVTPEVITQLDSYDNEKAVGRFMPVSAIVPFKANNALKHDYRYQPYNYRIGAYDVLTITVWDHPELSSTITGAATSGQNIYGNQSGTGASALNNPSAAQSPGELSGILVDPNGYIFFPYAGRFKVGGLTPLQAHAALQNRLSKYLRNPQVSVRVFAFRSQQVSVIGQVVHPSIAPITDKPLTVMDAINLSGGINPNDADPSHIFVVRGSMYHPVVFLLNATSPEGLLMANNFILQANDILYVPATGMTRFNRVINKILPTVQTIWFTRSVVKNT